MAALTLTGDIRRGSKRLSRRGRSTLAAMAAPAYTAVTVHGVTSTRARIDGPPCKNRLLELGPCSSCQRGDDRDADAGGLRVFRVAVRQRDDPYVDRRSELQPQMVPPSHSGADADRAHVQFDDAAVGLERHRRRAMNEWIEVVETVLDDAVQREFEIVRQTRTVIALTSDREARALGKARHDAQQGQTQTHLCDERRRQLIG